MVLKLPWVCMYKNLVVEWRPQTWGWRYLPKHDFVRCWPEPETLRRSPSQHQNVHTSWKYHNQQHKSTIWESPTRSQRRVENTFKNKKTESQSRAFNNINENYTDLVEANGLRDRRHKHDDGNCKALQFTWPLVRLKSSILVPWNIAQKPMKKLRLRKSKKILNDF